MGQRDDGPDAPVAVVIVTWNVAALLRDCLHSLARQDVPLEVLVVDNASADGTPAMVRSEFPHVRLLASERNLGFGGGNNRALFELAADGAARPAPELVFLLNPDTVVRPGAVRALRAHLAGAERAGAVGPLLRNADGTVQSSRRRFPTLLTGLAESTPLEWHWRDNPVARHYRMADVPPDAPGAVDWLTGAALLLRRRALAAVGPFDERFFMYSEELDLCRRLQSCGWEVRFEPAAEVVHLEGRSSNQVPWQRQLWFHKARVRYFAKHHGRLAATVVRGGVLAQFALETALEGTKWLSGHKRAVRRDRLRAYAGLLRDGLG